MTLLGDLFRQPVVIRLGWTLVHFLWQGAAIALVAACVLWALRRRSAEARYAFACGALALIAVCPLVTFAVLPQRPASALTNERMGAESQSSVRPAAARGDAAPAFLIADDVRAIAPAPSTLTRVRHIADGLLPWLVALWAAGVVVLSVRLLGGYLGVQRARCRAIEAPHPAMQRRLAELARRMGVTRPVRLLQSAHVAGPAVVGVLRPVILFPVWALTGLWPIQIEAILAHELAHITRHDYLVNLLQSIIETLLFYHPAVWWLSARIRQERENCCDDVAAEVCGDPAFYASSLAELDEVRGEPLALAMAATGGGLLPRIRRLLRIESRDSGFDAWTSGTLAATLVLAVMVILLARSNANRRHGQIARTAVASAAHLPPVAPARPAVVVAVAPQVVPAAPSPVPHTYEVTSDFAAPEVPAAPEAATPGATDGAADSWAPDGRGARGGADFAPAVQPPAGRQAPQGNRRPNQPAAIPGAPGNGIGAGGGVRGPGAWVLPPYTALNSWANSNLWPWHWPHSKSPKAKHKTKAPDPAGAAGSSPASPAPGKSAGETGTPPIRSSNPREPNPRLGPGGPAADEADRPLSQSERDILREADPPIDDVRPPDLRPHTISPARGIVVSSTGTVDISDPDGLRARQGAREDVTKTRPPAAVQSPAAFPPAVQRSVDRSRGGTQR